jgi:retron-type reverse transcriptase
MEANYKLITLDIKDVYVNIPIDTTISITKKLLKDNRVDDQIANELINILKTLLHQNYFQYDGKFYRPKTGTAMGSPLSSIIAEIFLQQLEQQILKHTLERQTITYYARYVDDIFIIYNP